jgi:hypothetical protein
MAVNNQEWHYSKGGQQIGPVSTDDLKQLAANGGLSPSDLIWKEGWSEWKQARAVKGLLPVEPPAMPVPPPLPQPSANPSLPTTPARNMPPLSPTASALLSSALWNPFVARLWCLLFTPAFGAFLTMQNWKTLGEEARAKRSMLWFYGFLAFLFLAVITPDTADITAIFRIIGCLMFVVWACTDNEKQVRFVKENFGSNYQHKSWGKPIGIGVGAVCCILILIGVNGSSFESATDRTDAANPPISNDSLLQDGIKLAAFRTLVDAYTNQPRGNISVSELQQHVASVQEAQDKFALIPFDPQKQRKEAKAIADLYMQRMYGNFSGELADNLDFDHMTSILEAVGTQVAIPEHIRDRWSNDR